MNKIENMRLKKISALGLFISFMAMSLLIFLKGPQISSDGQLFARLADQLLRDNFNVFRFLSEAEGTSPPLLYISFISVVALAKLLAGDMWAWVVILFNAINASAALFFLGLAGLSLGVRPIFVFLVLSSLVFSIDFLTWLPFVLTDMNFFLIVSFALFILTGREKMWASTYFLLTIFVAVFAVVSRPTGVALGCFIICVNLLMKIRSRDHIFLTKVRNWHVLIVGGVISVIVASLYSWVLVEACEGRIQSPTLQYLGSLFQQGIVIHDRPSTYVAPVSSVMGFFKIIWLRFFGFFYIYVPGHSMAHLGVNLLFFVPIYGLNIMGIYLWISETLGNRKRSEMLGALFALVFVLDLFHAFTVVDYDHRYRLAIIPPMLLVAMLVLEDLRLKFANDLARFGIGRITF
jgi:hypothetical protein